MTNRQNIYYWKCDRESAFSTLTDNVPAKKIPKIESYLNSILQKYLGSNSFSVHTAGGQGNHITSLVKHQEMNYFLRIDNGPEHDIYMEVETKVLNQVRSLGVPTPRVYECDTTRKIVPFVYQIMEFKDYPDLNNLHKKGRLDLPSVAEQIGYYMAKWQSIRPGGYGPFNPKKVQQKSQLQGYHESYQDYFFLNLNKHLNFLEKHGFLSNNEVLSIQTILEENKEYLNLESGCLVHKDLALWNILGDENHIEAVIDWSDTISGDPMDDISLLACFHSNDVIKTVLNGYEKVRSLPNNYLPRFWLHLLRNMIVKAVIRVGGDYFDKQDNFFLIGDWLNNLSLKEFTKKRIHMALEGLREGKSIEYL